jgi:hypothetical protein
MNQDKTSKAGYSEKRKCAKIGGITPGPSN